jgi:hypothetical protein
MAGATGKSESLDSGTAVMGERDLNFCSSMLASGVRDGVAGW